MSKYCAIMREKQDFKLLNKESLIDVLRGGFIQTLLHVVFAVVNIKYEISKPADRYSDRYSDFN